MLDVTPLRQMSAEAVKSSAFLYEPNDVIAWRRKHGRGGGGPRRFEGANPSSGAQFFYSLAENARSVSVEVRSLDGSVLHTVEEPPTEKGLHRVGWSLRRAPARGVRRRPTTVPAGTYVVALTVDGQTMTERFELRRDPSFPDAPTSARDEELVVDEDEEEGRDR